jgi:hypothetical protein
MDAIPYPKIRYQGVPRDPLTPHTQNPGYIWVRVQDADAERALGDNWHDTPADAIKSVPEGAKITADQYAALAAQAVERGALAPARPQQFADADKPQPAAHQASAHHADGPSDPSAQIHDPSDKTHHEGEWPVESEKRRRR